MTPLRPTRKRRYCAGAALRALAAVRTPSKVKMANAVQIAPKQIMCEVVKA